MAENAELQNRIRILEEQMKLARQQRFGKNANRWPGCSVPCSKRMLTRISQKSRRIWTDCFLRPGTKKKQQHVLFVKLYPHIFPGLKRLSRQMKNVARNVMNSCVLFVMKSARKWNISPHRLWSIAISVRSTAVPAVRKCSAENAGTYPSEKCC